MNISDTVHKNLAGIQLAIFETIWYCFEWIDFIYLKSDNEKCCLYIKFKTEPDFSEKNSANNMFVEIFNTINVENLKIQYKENNPDESLFLEIFSDYIFKMIANDVAPWRLDLGR